MENCGSCKFTRRDKDGSWWCTWEPEGMNLQNMVRRFLPGCIRIDLTRSMIVPVTGDDGVERYATYGYQGYINSCPTYKRDEA